MIAALLADLALAPILAALPTARVVGGAVRDALIDCPVADIDLATPLPPDDTTRALEAAGVRVIPTGLAHGTITAISRNRPFEITTLRRDVATDGRHAQVAWTDDWRADAARRDFTINAMSLDRAGGLHDPFGGGEDLAAGRIRFVGDPASRIAEDYLRILRFFRFSARYGHGAPDAQATQAIHAATQGLGRLSAERVWGELKKILTAPDPVGTIRLMESLGVLDAILPEGVAPDRLDKLQAAGAPADPLLRLAGLLTGDPVALAGRLGLANAEAARLLALQRGPMASPDMDDATLRRLLAAEPAEMMIDRTYLAGAADADWTRLRGRLASMPRPIFPLEGRDALALGAVPGPAIGEALRRTRAVWLEQGCTQDEAGLLSILGGWLAELQGGAAQGRMPDAG